MRFRIWLQQFRPNEGRVPWLTWLVLLALSAGLVLILELAGLPAALLLGPMIAAIALAARGRKVGFPPGVFYLSQGIVGCMIASNIPPTVMGELGKDWPFFLVGVLSAIVIAGGLGWLLTRWRVLPGTTAVWGLSPGAATAMVLMAESHGADMRLVAFMQYLRVVCVAGLASLVALLWTGNGGAQTEIVWFPAISWLPFAETLLLAYGGALVARFFRIPAGPLLLPLALGVILSQSGMMRFELPPWLLAISYAFVGWSIGLKFTRDVLAHALRAFPRLLASTCALIVACGGFAAILVWLAGVDPLTAYLATSPGGVDSVAIIAASSNVDIPFVMAMQTVRLLLVLLTCPSLARFIAARVRSA